MKKSKWTLSIYGMRSRKCFPEKSLGLVVQVIWSNQFILGQMKEDDVFSVFGSSHETVCHTFWQTPTSLR